MSAKKKSTPAAPQKRLSFLFKRKKPATPVGPTSYVRKRSQSELINLAAQLAAPLHGEDYLNGKPFDIEQHLAQLEQFAQKEKDPTVCNNSARAKRTSSFKVIKNLWPTSNKENMPAYNSATPGRKTLPRPLAETPIHPFHPTEVSNQTQKDVEDILDAYFPSRKAIVEAFDKACSSPRRHTVSLYPQRTARPTR